MSRPRNGRCLIKIRKLREQRVNKFPDSRLRDKTSSSFSETLKLREVEEGIFLSGSGIIINNT